MLVAMVMVGSMVSVPGRWTCNGCEGECDEQDEDLRIKHVFLRTLDSLMWIESNKAHELYVLPYTEHFGYGRM